MPRIIRCYRGRTEIDGAFAIPGRIAGWAREKLELKLARTATNPGFPEVQLWTWSLLQTRFPENSEGHCPRCRCHLDR